MRKDLFTALPSDTPKTGSNFTNVCLVEWFDISEADLVACTLGIFFFVTETLHNNPKKAGQHYNLFIRYELMPWLLLLI